MQEITLDLQAPIDGLRSIKSDLEAYYWDHPAHDETQRNERFQISFWIRQINDRTAALESLLLHKGTSRIVLAGLTPAERNAVQSAATLLEQWIEEDETFPNVFRAVAAVLGAADRISLKAAAGSPLIDPRLRLGSGFR